MLFVVMLGGKHPRAKIEVHDVVFAVADTLEATYPQLRADWFGSPKGVHIDAWMAVEGVDGWTVELSHLAPAAGAHHLYFINLGGYEANSFGEAHHYLLVVARNKQEAWPRAWCQASSCCREGAGLVVVMTASLPGRRCPGHNAETGSAL